MLLLLSVHIHSESCCDGVGGVEVQYATETEQICTDAVDVSSHTFSNAVSLQFNVVKNFYGGIRQMRASEQQTSHIIVCSRCQSLVCLDQRVCTSCYCHSFAFINRNAMSELIEKVSRRIEHCTAAATTNKAQIEIEIIRRRISFFPQKHVSVFSFFHLK